MSFPQQISDFGHLYALSGDAIDILQDIARVDVSRTRLTVFPVRPGPLRRIGERVAKFEQLGEVWEDPT
jgi:hypothetical protein